jgi:hypothetical protein
VNQRSKKHYRTDEGFKNKKRLNGRRSAAGRVREGAQSDIQAAETAPASSCDAASGSVGLQSHPPPDPAQQPTEVDLEDDADVKLTLDGFTLDEARLVSSPLLPYLAMVASVIEGRTIRADELLNVLLRCMRQRSFDRLPRREYVLRFLKQHPP